MGYFLTSSFLNSQRQSKNKYKNKNTAGKLKLVMNRLLSGFRLNNNMLRKMCVGRKGTLKSLKSTYCF